MQGTFVNIKLINDEFVQGEVSGNIVTIIGMLTQSAEQDLLTKLVLLAAAKSITGGVITDFMIEELATLLHQQQMN